MEGTAAHRCATLSLRGQGKTVAHESVHWEVRVEIGVHARAVGVQRSVEVEEEAVEKVGNGE